MSAPVSTVLWLPAHPTVGAVSMDRHWRELDHQRRAPSSAAGDGGALEIRCPLGSAPEQSRRADRAVRAWHKYIAYPWQTSRAARRPAVRAIHVLDHAFAHLLARVPAGVFKVATVHDLAPLREPDSLTPAQLARFRRTVGHLRLADLVLADSEHSAREAVELVGLSEERLRVLPLGVDVAAFAAPPGGEPPPAWRERLAGRRVVLSVGATAGRKNLEILPGVFRALGETLPGVPLALLRTGMPLPVALLDALRRELGEAGVIELGLVPDAELAVAYRHADALIVPSRIEGFGFPVLEAMAAGCPVACSNVTSLPEVGGDAARYFSPDDPRAAAAELARLFTDEAWRQEVVARGRARSAAFSWAGHYRKLLEIYRAGIGAARLPAGTPNP